MAEEKNIYEEIEDYRIKQINNCMISGHHNRMLCRIQFQVFRNHNYTQADAREDFEAEKYEIENNITY